MSSRNLTRSIIVGVAAIAVAGGSYGIVSATSGSSPAAASSSSSTTYQKQTGPASASAITKGEPVLVLGTTSNTAITATQITVEPAGSAYTAPSAKVIPFQQGAPTSKQAGQIPAAYTEGSGRIVSGTTADKATEAALAAYPGGPGRPGSEAQQRRIRGPLHRRQLAPPRLRQPGLQGRRRR